MNYDLLLLSNSQRHGAVPFAHAKAAVHTIAAKGSTIHFAPFALRDQRDYTARVRAALAELEIAVTGLDEVADVRAAVSKAEVLFVGGGNSFRLLDTLQRHELLPLVKARVAAGDLRYIGSSAGTNVACPTIRTTNDMPIVAPRNLSAFGLVPFQINPHFQDADPESTHMGETRMQRLEQFLEENDVPVVALREGAWLRRRGRELRAGGSTGGIVLRRGAPPQACTDGTDLSELLDAHTQFDCPA